MADRIEEILSQYEEGADEGYARAMVLRVLREYPPLYWVENYDKALNPYLGLNQPSNRGVSLRNIKIGAGNLCRRLERNNKGFDHLRYQRVERPEGDLVIILLNEEAKL